MHRLVQPNNPDLGAGLCYGGARHSPDQEVDPTDSNYVYYGGVTDLWQTTNGMGSSFRQISAGFGRPTALDIARANPNNVVVGFNGQVWVSTNAKAPSGVTFANITRDLPNRAVTRILFDPNDPLLSMQPWQDLVPRQPEERLPHNNRRNNVDRYLAAGECPRQCGRPR